MNAERAVYLDSSAIVKLAVAEAETAVLRRYLRGRGPLVSSTLARTEVARALLPIGATAVKRGLDVLRRIELIRISDRILADAGALEPPELRLLDAIHLATVKQLGASASLVVTYDDRMSRAAEGLGFTALAPS